MVKFGFSILIFCHGRFLVGQSTRVFCLCGGMVDRQTLDVVDVHSVHVLFGTRDTTVFV
jgi:hypothetical protein